MVDINKVFDRHYMINLNKDTDRFDNMVNVFKYIDLYDVFKWCGSTPTIFKKYSEVLNDVVFKNDEFKTQPRYLACLNSHLSIIQDAWDEGYESILIMEDDIIPVKDFKQRFSDFYNEVRDKNWDMLYLAYIRTDDDKQMWTYSNAEDDVISDNVIEAHNFWSGMAYALSRKAMKFILDWYSENYPVPIDNFYVDMIQTNPDFKCYGSHPQLFAGLDNFSNNTQREEQIFTRSANPVHLSMDDFYNPEDFPIVLESDFKGPRYNRDYDVPLSELQFPEKYPPYIFFEFHDRLYDSDDYKYNFSKVISQLPDHWKILVFKSSQEDWSKTIAVTENLYVTDEYEGIESMVINTKNLGVPLFDKEKNTFELFGKNINIKEFMKQLKTEDKYKDSIYHVYPGDFILRE